MELSSAEDTTRALARTGPRLSLYAVAQPSYAAPDDTLSFTKSGPYRFLDSGSTMQLTFESALKQAQLRAFEGSKRSFLSGP